MSLPLREGSKIAKALDAAKSEVLGELDSAVGRTLATLSSELSMMRESIKHSGFELPSVRKFHETLFATLEVKVRVQRTVFEEALKRFDLEAAELKAWLMASNAAERISEAARKK